MNKTYNQTKNNCTVFTIHQIFRNMYWIDFVLSFIDKMVNFFFRIKILFKKWAVFETIYNKEAYEASKKLDLDIIVKKQNILTTTFDKLTNNWYSWGLRLIHWNSKYLDAVEKWKITKSDIDAIAKMWGGFKHNNCFSSKWLDEVARWKRVEMTIEVLKYWVEKWVFWWTARSFIWNNAFTRAVWNLLIIWKDNPHYDPIQDWKTSDYYIAVMNKAANILWEYEIRPKYFDKKK